MIYKNYLIPPDFEVRQKIRMIGGMPDLHQFDHIFISCSGGKDSQAMSYIIANLATAQNYPKERIELIYADTELEWLLNKMKELAESGALEEIASGNDELQDPIPVFTFRDNKIIKTFTEKDEFGWPHIDNEGYLMYDNTFFRTEMECMRYAVKTLMIDVRFLLNNLSSEFDRMGKRIKYCAETSKALEDIYAGMRKNENASADRKPDGM